MAHLLWWNLFNCLDDVDDPTTADFVKSSRVYRRDLDELAEVLAQVEPIPDLIGCGEIEHAGVLVDLATAIARRNPARRYQVEGYVDGLDPRGIEVGALFRVDGPLHSLRQIGCWPADAEAVRPVVRIDCRWQTPLGERPLVVALLHGKSRNSGPTTRRDPLPGSRIRMAYGEALRDLSRWCGTQGLPLVVMGDFNDEPGSRSLVHGAQAVRGLPGHGVDPGRLYNLTELARSTHPGTLVHEDTWMWLDQILVNGVLIGEDRPRIAGRPRVLSFGPLLHQEKPNPWYSDHLPLAIDLEG